LVVLVGVVRLQAVDHITVLTVIFTFLVVIAATQGKGIHAFAGNSNLLFLLDIAVDGELLQRLFLLFRALKYGR
jgi:hypothetical protein